MATNRVSRYKLSYDNWAIFDKYDYFPMKFVDFYKRATSQRSDLSEWYLRANEARRFIKSLNVRGTQTSVLNDVVDRANWFNLKHDLIVRGTYPDKYGMTYVYPYDYHMLQSYGLVFRSKYYPAFVKAYFEILTKLIRREERRLDHLLTELRLLPTDVDETTDKIARDLEEMKLYVQEIDENELIPDPKIFQELYDRVRREIESLKLTLALEIERQRIPMASTPTRRTRRARICPDFSPIDPRTIRRDKDINVTFAVPGSPHPGVKIRIRGKMPREQSWVTRTPPPPRIDDPLIRAVVKVRKSVGFPVEQSWVIRTPPPRPRDQSRSRFPLEQNWILRTPPPPRIDDHLIRPTVITRQRRKFPVRQSWVIRTPPPRPAAPLDGNDSIIDDHIHGLDESFLGNPDPNAGPRAEDLDWSRDPHQYIEIPELGGRFRTREQWDDVEDREYMMSLHRQGHNYDRRAHFPMQHGESLSRNILPELN